MGLDTPPNKLSSHYRTLPLTMPRLKTWYSFVQAGSSCFKRGKYLDGWTDWYCSILQANLLYTAKGREFVSASLCTTYLSSVFFVLDTPPLLSRPIVIRSVYKIK